MSGNTDHNNDFKFYLRIVLELKGGGGGGGGDISKNMLA
jgi:hypothetical protein